MPSDASDAHNLHCAAPVRMTASSMPTLVHLVTSRARRTLSPFSKQTESEKHPLSHFFVRHSYQAQNPPPRAPPDHGGCAG